VQRKTWCYPRNGVDQNEYQKRYISKPWHTLEHKQSHFLKEPLDLTGSDSLEKEVKKATKIFANNDNVNFIVNDILNSKIKEKEFNYILRPCFHAANWRARNISKKSKGY
jgi:hypothetical protein